MEGHILASGVMGSRQGRRLEQLARRRGHRLGHGGTGARSRHARENKRIEIIYSVISEHGVKLSGQNREFAQVPLAHCPVAVDSPLQPPYPFCHPDHCGCGRRSACHRGTGAQYLWCDTLLREALLPHCYYLRHVNLLKYFV